MLTHARDQLATRARNWWGRGPGKGGGEGLVELEEDTEKKKTGGFHLEDDWRTSDRRVVCVWGGGATHGGARERLP